MYPERVVQRVLTKWHPEGECWVSDYSRGSHGYAQVGWKDGDRRTMTLAHRVSWWAAHRQPIPGGMTIDHLCRRRPCVNPLHLRLITNSENASDNGMGEFRTATETERLCRKGHTLVIGSTGRRHCRQCKAEWKRRRRAGVAF